MKTWFITGASRGFGALIAEQALARGDNVVATARHPDAVVERLRTHARLLPWRRSAIVALASAVFLTVGMTSNSTALASGTGGEMADNVQTIKRAFDEWAAGTGGPYTLLAENVAWTITGTSLASKTYPSREAFLGEVIRPFNARMSSSLRPTINELYSAGDTVIVYFDAAGLATDGKEYRNTYAWFLKMDRGQIVEAVAFFDSIVFNDLWTRVQPGEAASEQ